MQLFKTFACLLFAALCGVSLAKLWKVQEIPNPMTNPTACGRDSVPRSALCDPDHLVPKDKQDEVEGYIIGLKEFEVAVVIISSMDSMSVKTNDIDAAAEKFATHLHNSYGVGNKDTNNGILVFLSINDRCIYISTGSGVQKKFTAAYLDLVINNMKPSLRNKNYGEALATCILQLDLIWSDKVSSIAKHYQSTSTTVDYSGSDDNSKGIGIIIGVVAFMGMLGYGIYRDNAQKQELREYETGRTKLNRLLRDMELQQQHATNPIHQYSCTSCPICLEDFTTISSTSTTTDTINRSTVLTAAVELQRQQEEQQIEQQQHQIQGLDDSMTSSSTSTTTSNTATTIPTNTIENRKTVNLRCGHVFCIPCMEQYLQSERNNRCPICRQDILSNNNNNNNQPPPPPTINPTANPNANPTVNRTNNRSWFSSFGRRQTTIHPYQYQDDMTTQQSNYYMGTNTASQTTTYLQSPEERFFHHYSPEYRFRLHRMHYLYPRAVDFETLRILNVAFDRRSIHDVRYQLHQQQEQLLARTIQIQQKIQAAARSSGSHGSSRSSFGGGSSSGGRGGRW
jgi:uncharacterized membrane protein YgcG